MKKTLKYISLCLILALAFGLTPASAIHRDTNNFYFKDADFDYTLEKDQEGVSILKVKETLTAEFPDYDQNHGIVRSIPYKNQGGKNITIKDLTIDVKRNGRSEPIANINKTLDSFEVQIGSKDIYVHDTQVYTLEYEFRNVITDFDDFQELYWDTNGTGWAQKFDNVTATIHFADKDIAKNLRSDNWCYVGAQGEKGEDRCTFQKNEDGSLSFSSSDLDAYENMTFVIQFNPETFIISHNYNYALVVIAIVASIIAFGAILGSYLYWSKKAKSNYHYRKKLFAAPQYQPPENLTVAEAGLLSLTVKKQTYVATLLELAVKKKISLKEGEPTKLLKRKTWIIIVHDTSNLTTAQTNVLKILNDGDDVKDGAEIKIQNHEGSSYVESLARKYDTSTSDLLIEKGFLLKRRKRGNGLLRSSISFILGIAIFMPTFGILPIALFYVMSEDTQLFFGEIVGLSFIIPYLLILLVTTVIIVAILLTKTKKYSCFTEKGLDVDNYLEGLKLYIEMAEKDRLAFLQSVNGAPRNEQDIVHLYEKLLPYACLFDLEKSWLSELNKYYSMSNISNPDWCSSSDLITSAAVFDAISHDVSRSISSSTTYTSGYSSSGSSYSSSSSGGSSSGSSGGGGGGGGGGGW